ncbi:hypothetical protein BpHYR1_006394 [Brachionus plicatilis]|uniref:Uncharacterized protein n=1 Tax=Brachionus plicatilis TaxID=10195 RepID=A0A3M7SYW2_BRAPC|nr:hypothetical protein BpHYR1_006394 [Brachionus plicatilis]
MDKEIKEFCMCSKETQTWKLYFFNGCIGRTILRLLSLYLNNFGSTSLKKVISVQEINIKFSTSLEIFNDCFGANYTGEY